MCRLEDKADFNLGQRPCGKVQSFEGKFNAQILYLDTTCDSQVQESRATRLTYVRCMLGILVFP